MAIQQRERRKARILHHRMGQQAGFQNPSSKRVQLVTLTITILLFAFSLASNYCASYQTRSPRAQQQQARGERRPHHDYQQLYSGSEAGEFKTIDEATNLNDFLRLLATQNQRPSSASSLYHRDIPKLFSSSVALEHAPRLLIERDNSEYDNDELLLNEANFFPLNSRQLVTSDVSTDSEQYSLRADEEQHPYLSLPAIRFAELLSSRLSTPPKQNKLTNLLYLHADEPATNSEIQNSIDSDSSDYYKLLDKEDKQAFTSKHIDTGRERDEKAALPTPAVFKLTTLLENEQPSAISNLTVSSASKYLNITNNNIAATANEVADNDSKKETSPSSKEAGGSYNSSLTTNTSQIDYVGTVSGKIKPSGDPTASLWSLSAMFSNLYNSLASLLPNFHKEQTVDTSSSNSTTLTMSKNNVAPLETVSPLTSTSDTKQSVSAGLSVEPFNNKKGEKSIVTDASDNITNLDLDEPKKNKLASTVSNSEIQSQQQKRTLDGSYLDSQFDYPDVVPIERGSDLTSSIFNNDKRFISTSAANVKPTTSSGYLPAHRVSLMRQSNYGLPDETPEDQLLGGAESELTPVKPTISYGDYVLAGHPSSTTHHYSPFGVISGKVIQPVAAVDADQVYGQLSSRPYLRHLRPSESVYSSYSSPLYQTSGEGSGINSVTNKTNDIYFLVMVVAFCAMAVAVVLSAGLFAYRVQQSRKITNEQDYPTYGVVGPNNINGKCAASFVGGYFTGGVGSGNSGVGSSSSSCNKAANLKYQPDYVDSGVAANASKSSSVKSKKFGEQTQTTTGSNASAQPATRSNSGFMVDNQNAARMYHYQHQKQQMIISDITSTGRHTSASDLDSEEDNEEGSYTVYECPGLASAHEMEIKNPLFNDNITQ